MRLHQTGYSSQKAIQIVLAPTLRNQPPSRPQRTIQIAEQTLVIQHPMKRSRAENSVEFVIERQLQQVAANKLNTLAEFRLQISARRLQHILRNIQRHHLPFWQRLE